MFIKPCKGYITSLFSNSRLNPVLGVVRPHWGTDYGNHVDNTIIAAAAGKVRIAIDSTSGFGKYVVITHSNGWETLYAHLSVVSVSDGQSVKQGQKIGVKGSTGNSTGIHLHFEISKGKWSNSYTYHVNPALYVDDPDVRRLQTMLNQLGYKVAVDGLYGDGMVKVVTTYQKSCKLTADGVAGPMTMAEIDKSISALVPLKKEVIVATEPSSTIVSPSHAEAWEWAKEKGFLNGERPKESLTREQFASVLKRAFDELGKK